MNQEYVISFSSFYKAAYAQDMLEEAGIASTLKKLPTELVRSCSTGLYLRTDDIQRVKAVLSGKQIAPGGIYLIRRSADGHRTWKRSPERPDLRMSRSCRRWRAPRHTGPILWTAWVRHLMKKLKRTPLKNTSVLKIPAMSA